mgnify:CR=1 FL=1
MCVHVEDCTHKCALFSGYHTWQMEESEDITQIYLKTAALPASNLQASEQLVRPVSIITTGAAGNLVIYAKACLTHLCGGEYRPPFPDESTAGLR